MSLFKDDERVNGQLFNNTRLGVARRRRGWSKKEFAELLSVSLRYLSGLESSEFSPAQELVRKISDVCNFPIQFFYEPDLQEPNTDVASFRALSKMSASSRDSALAQGALGHLVSEWLEERFLLPNPNLPEIDHEPDWRASTPEEKDVVVRLVAAEAAAVQVRNHWALGEQPIANLLHLLESQGVRIFSLALDCLDVDAFSHWKDNRPFIFLNVMKSAEHSRFDAAHELGHLVMHKHAIPHGRAAEREADAFASAFLMPRGSLAAYCPPLLVPSTLAELKLHWRVSVAALNYRLHTLEFLTDWQYRTNCIEIARRGWRIAEPNPLPRETSQVLGKMLSLLYEEKLTRGDIARLLHLHIEELEKLLFGLVISATPGVGRTQQNRAQEKTKLRLVR